MSQTNTADPAAHVPLILVVDDEMPLLDLLTQLLEQRGFRAEGVSRASEARAAIEQGLPADLLLTDLMLGSKETGIDLARSLRALVPDLPVVFMSGFNSYPHPVSDDIGGLFLRKPCSPDALVAAIRDSLADAPPGAVTGTT